MLSFKAGRCNRRAETNWVDPLADKGLIHLETSADDGLLHFSWKDRTTGATDEDLILFPSEATFLKVNNVPSGRVYVLKFSSSDQRYFFWMQDADTSRDEYYARSVNGLLEDPSYVPAPVPVPVPIPAPAPAPAASTSTAAASAVAGSSHLTMEEQVRQLRELIQGATAQAGDAGPELSLTDVITPQTLEPLLARPDLLEAIFPNLPADLPGERNADTLRQVIQSPAFRTSLRGLQQALNTGLLSNLVVSLGLPPEAGLGVGPFLQAISEQARRSSTEDHAAEDEHMETD